VLSVKNGLKKSAVRITKQHLNELTFAINTTASSEGTENPAEKFFGRSVRSRLPNSIDRRGKKFRANRKKNSQA